MVAQLGEQQSQQEGLTWKGKKWTTGEEQNSGMGNRGGAKLLGRRKLAQRYEGGALAVRKDFM
jgi:hypothetical protein